MLQGGRGSPQGARSGGGGRIGNGEKLNGELPLFPSPGGEGRGQITQPTSKGNGEEGEGA